VSSPITHLVVLMLENRSFDSILGFLRPKSDDFDGLTGRESNVSAEGDVVPVVELTGTEGYVTDPDPPHEHEDVMFDLFGPDPGAGHNQGFAARYQTAASPGVVLAPQFARKVMSAFDTHDQLPAIAALADEFRVCDAWFSSSPGPTWPNRAFAHCATSGGYPDNPSDFTWAWSEVGSVFNMPTIFENLSAADRTWGVYYHDVPLTLSLARLHHYRDHFKHFASFLRDCESGNLPSYSFIEPGFFDVALLGLAANDMHPSHDVRRGDALVAAVYNALRANESLWASSMLLVVWDEHGGFYDHVFPPPAVVPDEASRRNAKFQFDRLGVRVPAIVVSPWVARGGVDHTPYEHASIPATLKRLFSVGTFLTLRDARANPFDRDLLDRPRTDAPASISSAGVDGLPLRDEAALNTHQKSLLSLVTRLDVPGVAAPDEANIAASILHVARYLDV
jgi:phospholipase C